MDLQGRTLLPAFLDAHSHLAASANALLQVPLGDAACFEDIAQAISGFIRRQRVKPGQWVMAQGYDHNQLAEPGPSFSGPAGSGRPPQPRGGPAQLRPHGGV